MTTRAAVLGSPVGHSLSPALHRAAYAELGLDDWTYDAYDVTADGLAAFLSGLDRTWAGLSLTMPLKAAVLPLLAQPSDVVREVGAANTVLPTPSGLRGENTDVPGLVAAMREAGLADVGSAVVLGGGATASSTLAALRDLGVMTARVFVRDPGRAAGLHAAAARLQVDPVVARAGAERWWDPAVVAGADLVVATTPSGSTDAIAGTLPDRVAGVLLDVVYDPWPTPLARAWAERGGRVLGGLDLLVHQAVLQVALMTGRPDDPAVLLPALRAVGERALRDG